MNDYIKTVILGIVEGVTEFLPVSSTGHLKLTDALMGPLVSAEFANNFEIFIQIGAILAVVVFFRQKLLYLVGLAPHDGTASLASNDPLTPTDPLPYQAVSRTPGSSDRVRTLLLLLVATLPLGPGYILAKKSDQVLLANPALEVHTIAAALGIGGILMILIERFKPKAAINSMSDMTYVQAVIIGACQILAAVFPGTSRSAATIMPALCLGISRPVAAEFSFFLAIPAMFGAAGIKLLKFLKSHDASRYEMLLLGLGTFVSFVVAYVVIAAFMGFIRRYSFTVFGVYRILLAANILLLVRA